MLELKEVFPRKKWKRDSDRRDKIKRNWINPDDYSRSIVAENIIVFYDYLNTQKEVAIWRFDTEEEMIKVHDALQKELNQTTKEIIFYQHKL